MLLKKWRNIVKMIFKILSFLGFLRLIMSSTSCVSCLFWIWPPLFVWILKSFSIWFWSLRYCPIGNVYEVARFPVFASRSEAWDIFVTSLFWRALLISKLEKLSFAPWTLNSSDWFFNYFLASVIKLSISWYYPLLRAFALHKSVSAWL